jgi:tagatose-6-phosphate ketose/aldose isomerase
MDYLGKSQEDLEKAGGYWTAREISQQPTVWREVHSAMRRDAEALRKFISPLLNRKELRIVLTGAGTSSFVGGCLAPALIRHTALRVDAVATTDLVGSPENWLAPAVPTLLVSFARSGNSPESVAALKLVDQATRECHHLIFTCNRDGALYRQGQNMHNARVVLLPEETNDRGFAMTSSFSGMLLAAALAFDLLGSDTNQSVALARWASEMLGTRFAFIQELARAGFERVVYLGSNECKGLAQEGALKMLELSDGKMVTLSETPLGFRHGPKTIVNGKTLVVMFLCNEPYTRRYEIDVLGELRADGVAGRVVALTAQDLEGPERADNISVSGAMAASDLGLCFPYAVFAQTLAFLQSLALGLRPDVPNAKGTVNRVVQGVSIYPWGAKG